MTTLDALIRPLANDLIAKYGKPMLLRVTDSAEYDPATGDADVYRVSYDLFGLVSTPERLLYDPGVVGSGDVQVLLGDYTLDIPPKAGDLITMDGVDWTVVSVQSTFSGEQAAIHTLLLRK